MAVCAEFVDSRIGQGTRSESRISGTEAQIDPRRGSLHCAALRSKTERRKKPGCSGWDDSFSLRSRRTTVLALRSGFRTVLVLQLRDLFDSPDETPEPGFFFGEIGIPNRKDLRALVNTFETFLRL
jgi:hypothetical protein